MKRAYMRSLFLLAVFLLVGAILPAGSSLAGDEASREIKSNIYELGGRRPYFELPFASIMRNRLGALDDEEADRLREWLFREMIEIEYFMKLEAERLEKEQAERELEKKMADPAYFIPTIQIQDAQNSDVPSDADVM